MSVAASHTKSPGLARRLSVWDAVAIYVGVIIGSGIFVAPAGVAGAAPGLGSASLLWLAGGVVAACGAFCYAECGARLPKSGGFYVFYRAAYGEPVAFVGGWAAILITYPASIAGIALVFGRYLAELVPALAEAVPATGAAALLTAGLINYVGVQSGAWTQRLLTGVKVLAIVLLCIAAMLGGEPSSAALPSPALFSFTDDIGLLTTAMVILLWTYDGWTDFTLVAGELKDPGRTLKRTVIISTLIVTATYSLVQVAVTSLLGSTQAAASEGVLAAAAEAGLGAGRWVALLVVVSTLGSINGVVLAGSRVGFAMAGDKVLPAWFGAVHPRFQTPSRSLLALVGASLVYVFVADFKELMAFFSFNVWIFYGLTAVALVLLRRRGVGDPGETRAPLGLLCPTVVLGTGAAMSTSLLLDNPTSSLLGLVALFAGFPMYWLWRSLRG